LSETAADFVVLGKVADAYALQGVLRVHPFGDDPLAWKEMPVWWLRPDRDGAEWQPYKLRQCRLHGGSVLVGLDGIDDRTQAEARQGWLIGAPRAALPATGKDEYYWADLVGLEVVNEQGQSLGQVEGLIETGANAVIRVVDAAGTERLLPYVGAVVLAVDLQARRISVDWGLDW